MITEAYLRGRRPRRAVWALVAVLAVVCGAAAGAVLARSFGSSAAGAPDVAGLEELQRGFTWIAETVKPSVVFIEVEQKSGPEPPARVVEPPQEDEQPEGELDVPDPWRQWRRFFGPGAPSPLPQPGPRTPSVGQGSGVIIDPAGYILTNNHVVRNAEKVIVHTEAQETYMAEVVGTDSLTDLAVLKVKPKQPLPAARLGDAGAARPGMWVVAAGYHFGGRGRTGYGGGSGVFDAAQQYEPTVTVGVISATDRQIQSDIPGRPFRFLIQTDAPINPGSSGGPLVNIHAEVIGINQAIFTSPAVGGNIGVGFAIAINEQNKDVIDRLKTGKAVVRGQLGVLVKALTPALREVYGAEDGVFVDGVQPDSPASRGGIKAEDIITKYDGRAVVSQGQFVTMVEGTDPGATVRMEVLRDGRSVPVKVTIEAYSVETAERKPEAAEQSKLGLSVEPLPEEQARTAGLSAGVRIRQVDPLSDGARAGLARGDVIVKINQEQVTDVGSYERVVSQLKEGDAVVIRAWTRRSGSVTTFEIDSLSQ